MVLAGAMAHVQLMHASRPRTFVTNRAIAQLKRGRSCMPIRMIVWRTAGRPYDADGVTSSVTAEFWTPRRYAALDDHKNTPENRALPVYGLDDCMREVNP